MEKWKNSKRKFFFFLGLFKFVYFPIYWLKRKSKNKFNKFWKGKTKSTLSTKKKRSKKKTYFNEIIYRSIGGLNKTSRSIKAWSDCTGERDQLIFYDGSSTNDPVLAKFCGGDWLPRVVSR